MAQIEDGAWYLAGATGGAVEGKNTIQDCANHCLDPLTGNCVLATYDYAAAADARCQVLAINEAANE
jgi:hypothetical protein